MVLLLLGFCLLFLSVRMIVFSFAGLFVLWFLRFLCLLSLNVKVASFVSVL